MDIISVLPTSVSQKKLLLVATDCFSKWVEVESYASVKDKDVIKLVWKNIECWFEIPHAIITDNEPQFNNSVFRTFYLKLNIKNLYSMPQYPKSNGQVETTNKTLLNSLKKRLEETRGNG